MLKAFKFRLYPNKSQEILLAKHFGCARWMYNFGLAEKIKAYEKKEKLSCFDICNNLTELKENQEFSWLNEVNSQSLQMAARNLDNAFQRFFKEKKGFPKFKSKKSGHNSFQCPQHVVADFGTGHLQLPKFTKKNKIKADFHRTFEGKIKTVTISKAPSGKYFASILVDDNKDLPLKQEISEKSTIGIDTGIKTFLTISNGTTYENPKYLKKSLKKLARLNRANARKKSGSNNRTKSRIKLAKQHEYVANQRNDYIHKVTSQITNDKQVKSICIEDLDIKGMAKTKKHAFNRALSDVSLGKFYGVLTYKCEWKGINLIKIGQFEASSKTCSNDSYVKTDLTLADRNWVCPVCGTNHDRDLNAAINIKKFGLICVSTKNKLSVLPERQEFTLGEIRNSGSMNQEAPSFRAE